MDISQDIGHLETEDLLRDLEVDIAKEYAQAEKEVRDKLSKYMKDFERKDLQKQAQLKAGEITQNEYNQWRVGQIAVGQRWAEMRDTLAEDFTKADLKAMSITYGYMPEAYAINHNYGTYQVEKLANVDTSYTLYDRQTVERLMDDGATLYHAPGKKTLADIQAGKTLAWNKKQVQSCMMQALLQGESIPKIAARLAKTVGEKDRKAAVRNARTITTGVENAGRVDSYKRAEKMGIGLMQEWLATLDGRTRHEHRLLDGQRVKVGEKFQVEGYELEYPGDPTGEAFLIYNCRCTLVPALDKFAPKSDDLSLRNTNHMDGMTYDGWRIQHYLNSPKKKNLAFTKKEADNDYINWAYRIANNSKGNNVVAAAIGRGVEKFPVYRLFQPMTQEQIIAKVGGKEYGDAKGSCASLGWAYLGNRFGLDVRDMRGGESRKLFANRIKSTKEISKMAGLGMGAWTETNKDDFKAAHALMEKTKIGKEYVMATGHHLSIIRKTQTGYEYLELQSEKNNGFKPLDDKILKSRFGCKRGFGKKKPRENILIDADFLEHSDEFRECLEYINTPLSKQKKR